MNIETIAYLLSMLIVALVSFVLAHYAWTRPRRPATLSYSLLAFSQALWTLCFALTPLSQGLAQKLLIDQAEWMLGYVMELSVFRFALAYTGRRLPRARLTWPLLLVPPLFFVILVFTNDLHHLMYSTTSIVATVPFSQLFVGYTPITFAAYFCAFALVPPALWLLIRYYVQASASLRTQTAIICAGVLIPSVVSILALVLDNDPNSSLGTVLWGISYALATLLLAIGMFRFRLFSVVPIARDFVFDTLSDAVIVVDPNYGIVDLNHAARTYAESNISQLVGWSLAEAFPRWLDQLEGFRSSEDVDTEFVSEVVGRQRHLDLKVRSIHDKRGKHLGRLALIRDITERKRAEAMLRESEARFRSFVEQSTEGVVLTDEQGRVVEWNRSQEQITGLKRDEVVGQALWEIQYRLAPDARRSAMTPASLKHMLLELLQMGQASWAGQPIENELQRVDGTLRNVQAVIFPIQREAGYIAASILQDITERTRTETELARYRDHLEQLVEQRTAEVNRAKTRLEAILNNTTDGIALASAQRGIELSNVMFRTLFACEPDGYFGQPLLSLVHPEDRDHLAALIAAVTADRVGRHGEFRAVRADNTLFEARLGVGYVQAGESQEAGLVCSVHDISEFKARERLLRYHASLQENVSDAVIATDLYFRIQSWNPAAERIYGWSADEVLGRSVGEILPTEFQSDERSERVQRDFLEKGSWTDEVIQSHKDGRPLHILSSTVLFKDETGQPFGIVAVNHDITQRIKAEEALNAKIEEEREFQNSLRALHEITIELTQVDQLDEFYRSAVELGLERLGFDRLSLFLYDAENHSAVGTYGTDPQGKPVAERDLRFVPAPNDVMGRAFGRAERFYLEENVRLSGSHAETLGSGWNAAATLWNGTQSWGWLVADNLFSHKPASKPLLEMMSLYALTIGTLLARKQTEAALRDSEARYHQMFEQNKAVKLVIDPQTGAIVDANAAACAYYGHSLDALKAMRITDINTLSPENVFTDMQQAGANSRTVFEFCHRLASGEIRDVEVYSGPVQIQGKPLLHSIIVDITERKKAERALQESEARYRLLAEVASEGIQRVDPDARITYVNPQLQAMLGYRAEEMIGHEYFDFLHPSMRASAQERFEQRKLGLRGKRDVMMLHQDGSYSWALASSAPILGANGEYQGTLTMFTDIGERKWAETVLQESESRLRESQQMLHNILETMPVRVFWKDRDSIYLGANRLYAQDTGFTSAEQLVGKTDFDLSSPERAVEYRADDQAVMDSGVPRVQIRERVTRVDGAAVWLQTSKSPLKDSRGATVGIIGAYVEVTKLKQAEEELRRALEQQRELVDLKARFISMASHDFRTPMSVILSSLSLLEMQIGRQFGADQLEPFQKRLTRIDESVRQMTSLLDDVLAINRADTGKVEIHPELLDVESLCKDILQEAQLIASPQHRLTFSFTGEQTRIVSDKQLLRQILVNLLSNAVKYSPDGGNVLLDVRCEPEMLEFRVQDEGIGIPDRDQARLFETFHRAHNVGGIQGTGLGMAIVKRAVDALGGMIAFESHVDVGTTFTVRIPAEVRTD